MNIKGFLKTAISAALLPIMLLTGCGGDNKEINAAPSEVLEAVTKEITVESSAVKNESELKTYYSGIDESTVESAAMCLSVGHPDEIAIIKLKTSSDAQTAVKALKEKLEKQKETYKDYTPEEMFKLEDAQVYSVQNYAVYLAVSDNSKAKSIVDEKLKG